MEGGGGNFQFFYLNPDYASLQFHVHEWFQNKYCVFYISFQEAIGHEGAKPQKAIYLRNGRLLTVGFSRMSERQYALRKEVSQII